MRSQSRCPRKIEPSRARSQRLSEDEACEALARRRPPDRGGLEALADHSIAAFRSSKSRSRRRTDSPADVIPTSQTPFTSPTCGVSPASQLPAAATPLSVASPVHSAPTESERSRTVPSSRPLDLNRVSPTSNGQRSPVAIMSSAGSLSRSRAVAIEATLSEKRLGLTRAPVGQQNVPIDRPRKRLNVDPHRPLFRDDRRGVTLRPKPDATRGEIDADRGAWVAQNQRSKRFVEVDRPRGQAFAIECRAVRGGAFPTSVAETRSGIGCVPRPAPERRPPGHLARQLTRHPSTALNSARKSGRSAFKTGGT